MVEPEATKRPPSSFDEFAGDLPNSYVHVLSFMGELKGTEKKCEMEMRYSFTPGRTQHWLQIFYNKSPLGKEKDNLKMCMWQR